MNGFVSLCLTCVVIAVVIAAYLLPTLIAWLRRVPDIAVVIVVNIALGWTVLGWWVALVVALRRAEPPVVQVISQVNAPAHPLPGSAYWASRPWADDSHPDPRWFPPADAALPPEQ